MFSYFLVPRETSFFEMMVITDIFVSPRELFITEFNAVLVIRKNGVTPSLSLSSINVNERK
jgi:hypothetical protein